MQNFLKKTSGVAKQQTLFGGEAKIQANIHTNNEEMNIESDDSDSLQIVEKVKNAHLKQSVDVEMKDGNQNKVFAPWVEKYRPSKIEEVSHQMEVVSALNQSIKTGQLPHLLLYGPPGTGKTSTILALAKEMFGKNFYRHRILELNASDERGIQVVREKIKKFAQRKISKNPDIECPPIQICILDEADSMTIDAQAALRRIIEAYSTNTRFCIICNYISKIIDPLASRCVKFRFSPISFEAQKERLQYICMQENISIESDQVLKTLIEISEGDLRRSINTLQTCSSFTKAGDSSSKLTQEDIEKISGVVPISVIKEAFEQILKPQNGFSAIQEFVQDLILNGYDVQQLIVKLMQYFIDSNDPRVSDLKKAKISELVAETDFKMIQGGDEELNLLNVFIQMKS